MTEHFPSVGVIGLDPFFGMMLTPARALGVDLVSFKLGMQIDVLAQCVVTTTIGDFVSASQVRTLEKDGVIFRPSSASLSSIKEWNKSRATGFRGHNNSEAKYSVLVARSPHGQASSWVPTEIDHSSSHEMTITPAPSLTSTQIIDLQSQALGLIRELEFVGVMDVEILLEDGKLVVSHMSVGPTLNGLWTIEGARTSQFEQHLRAILDLPLGDPSLTAGTTVSSTYSGEGNMYRPYLHLMARSPDLKFHQYRSEALRARGHVTAMGEDLLDLRECVTHAVEYMSGVIDE